MQPDEIVLEVMPSEEEEKPDDVVLEVVEESTLPSLSEIIARFESLDTLLIRIEEDNLPSPDNILDIITKAIETA